MNPRASISPSSLLFLSFFLLFSSTATAFNITRLLGNYPEFSKFNDYLTQTQLYSEINHRRTITVLAVENSDLSTLAGNSLDVIKMVLSLHVVLDYFDVAKLGNLSKKTALLTTLFQSSGIAANQQGFLNVTELSTGEVAFGSAVKGSSLNAKLVKLVAAQPYNISVLQISTPIVAPGLAVVTSPSPAPSKKTPTQSPAKAPVAATPKSAEAPAPFDDSSNAPSDDNAPADAPADAPSDADAPADAPSDAPAFDAPISSPPSPGAADDAPALSPSSGTRVGFGACFVVMGLVSSLVAFL